MTVLSNKRRILDEEYPFTITAINNLAIAFGKQGQLDKAAKMLKKVLKTRRYIFGEKYLDTTLAMSNFANTFEKLVAFFSYSINF